MMMIRMSVEPPPDVSLLNDTEVGLAAMTEDVLLTRSLCNPSGVGARVFGLALDAERHVRTSTSPTRNDGPQNH
ncbi:hypothetical protein GCM10011609_84920 [Lentzea pudingi]|uniref:Uncharacterized protein n=1 Tax=Lentzea pudingi TaxID=1789439 RepID=A0ABQ2IV94_9PSEU|nr:hypothetical protein GCM10011609_84920 [Lentzea pudingi]